MSMSQTLRESPAPEDELATELAWIEAEEAIEEQECLKRECEAVEQKLRWAGRERWKEEMQEEMRHREEEKRKAREEAERKAEEEWRRKEQEEQEWKEQEEWAMEEQERRQKEKEVEKEKERKDEETKRKRTEKGKDKVGLLGASLPLKKKQKVFVGTSVAGPSRPAQEREIVEIEDDSEEEPGAQKKMGGKNPCWKCRNTGYPCKPHLMKSRNACIRCTQMHGRCVEKRPPLPKWEGVLGPAGNGMTQEQGVELLLVMQALAQSTMQVAEGVERLVEVMERMDRWQEATLRVLERPEDGAEEVRDQEDATAEKPEVAGTGEMGEQGDEEGSEGSSSGEENSREEEGLAGDGIDLGE